MRAERAFSARAVSTFAADRLYRVYVCGDRLAFVKIAGQGGVAEGVAAQFGLLGSLLLAWWKKRSRNQLRQRLTQEDRQDVELLLSRDPKNFVIPSGQVRRAAIEPPTRFGAHGRHHGIWRLEETGGRKHVFQFEEVAQMREAVEVLPRLLGEALTVSVKWDESKGRYTKTDSANRAA